MSGSGNKILVRRIRAGRSLGTPTVARRAARLLDLLDLRGAELSIVLCDDAFIRSLNRDYRGRDLATDVLSFAQDGDARRDESPLLGDVVISLETATRQARARRSALAAEVTALLVHGVLHLLGHDHEDPRAADRMRVRAEALEKALKGRKSVLTGACKSIKKRPRPAPQNNLKCE